MVAQTHPHRSSYEDSVRRLSQEKGRLGLVELDAWWRTVSMNGSMPS